MLTSKVLKLAVTEGSGNEWKVQPVDEKSSFIMFVQVATEISVIITGPFNIRLTHTDGYPLKAYIRHNDLAIKFWNFSCWRKVQVTLSDRMQLLLWAQKFREFGVIVVNKDELNNGRRQGSMIESQAESQMMESQRVVQMMESQRVGSQMMESQRVASERVESQAHASLWMVPPPPPPPPPLSLPLQPIPPPEPSRVNLPQAETSIRDLSGKELKRLIVSCLDRKDFVELVS
ncbi:hypothetical protein CANINC_000051 [Pichia inconspicua]|uniref:Uncharacterized protein n=1 Tax=Pichia inconspicua TaxID=52247 RepID=A0A4V4NGB7_9ASCO|nr:hypothetical protein CANINC_000051 [[Candida] inconspicua]